MTQPHTDQRRRAVLKRPRGQVAGVSYPSVLAALEGGEGYAVNIAQYTGLHVSTVRKILNGYERKGIAGRWHGNGTARMPDYWEIVPPEHRADARRRHSQAATDEEEQR